MKVEDFFERVEERDKHMPQLLDVVGDLARSVEDFINANRHYERERILERLAEPDRILQFKVIWENDQGAVQINRAWRVQHSNAIGPYKGGLRFDTSVNADVLRALAFEQTFKNALTGIPLGGAKGGTDFTPRGKSDREVMRFCHAFMTELFRHISEDIDVPAGDIGVGEREIGYLMGAYRRLTGKFTGVMTGKGLSYGGSEIRTEATGYGLVYFADEALRYRGDSLEGKEALVSGAGAVALYAVQKLIDRGASVLTVSDRGGTLHVPEGIDDDLLAELKSVKLEEYGDLQSIARERNLEFHSGGRPWQIAGQLAFPCATENELDKDDAESLVENGVEMVLEGANMPCTEEARSTFAEADVVRAPGKAANAGGVAVSGIEMMQNRMNSQWSRTRVHDQLKETMQNIHAVCVRFGKVDDTVDYARGADIAGFKRVAEALLSYGVI